MSDVSVVKEKVRRILIDRLGSVEEDRDGDFTIRNGSARIFIRVMERNEEATLVRVWSLVALGVPKTPELFEHVALSSDGYYFGHLGLFETPEDGMTITFSHNLLGDYLDAEELMYAVGGVASSADQLDDELVAKFGGRTFSQ
jgi:hypothetical protein